MRRPLTWLVTLPLAFGSTLLGHDIALRLLPPKPAALAPAFVASTPSSPHGVWLPYAIGALVTFLVVGLAVRVLEAAAGEPRRGGAGIGLAAAPLLIFVLEEHIAPLLSGTYVNLIHVSLEPRFALGLLLQLPCGLLACLVARFLLRAADELGYRLRGREDDSALSLPSRPPWAAVVVDLPRVPALGLGYGERGPPR
jgi:hypothetical protein